MYNVIIKLICCQDKKSFLFFLYQIGVSCFNLIFTNKSNSRFEQQTVKNYGLKKFILGIPTGLDESLCWKYLNIFSFQ